MSPETSDTQTLRKAFQGIEGRAGTSGSCPTPEAIWEAARGRPDRRAVAAIVEHTVSCGECAEAWRLAVAFEQPPGRLLSLPRRAATALSWPQRLAAVAAVAALVAVGLTLLRGPTPGYRSDPTQEIRSLLPEGAILPRERCLLSWSEVPGAASYELEVTTEDLRPVVRLETLSKAQHRVSASALAALPDGTLLYWRVTAVFADGRRVASTTFSARLGNSSRER